MNHYHLQSERMISLKEISEALKLIQKSTGGIYFDIIVHDESDKEIE